MAIALAFVCAIVYGVADYSGGRASRSAPSIAVGLYGQIASAILALTTVLVIGTTFAPVVDLIWGGIAGLAGAVALVCFYHALSHGAMTVVAPITAVTSAVLPVLFGLARGERPRPLAYVGMIAAVGAVALVSGAVGQREIRTPRSTVMFALVAGLGFAVIFIALGETSDESGVWPLVAARLVSVAVIIALVAATHTAARGHGSAWRLAGVAGVLDMTANFLYLQAVQRGLLSVVVVVVALYPVSTVCLAFGLDHERVSRSQAWGMGLAVSALVLVSVAGAG
ncbi:MAG: DMT family transporter [Ilumatobacteraceae bacterium]